jgi:hypothetical protein
MEEMTLSWPCDTFWAASYDIVVFYLALHICLSMHMAAQLYGRGGHQLPSSSRPLTGSLPHSAVWERMTAETCS